jgi:hypothetical protein
MKRQFICHLRRSIAILLFSALFVSCDKKENTVYLLKEDFSGQVSGPLLSDPGASLFAGSKAAVKLGGFNLPVQPSAILGNQDKRREENNGPVSH